MRGMLPSGEPVEKSKRVRLCDPLILKDRARLIHEYRTGTGCRQGHPKMSVIEIARLFNLNRIYVHRIIASRMKRLLEQEERRQLGQQLGGQP